MHALPFPWLMETNVGKSPTAVARGIHIETPELHHVALRSSDLARSRIFYIERLGFPVLVEERELLIFGVGARSVVVRGAGCAIAAG